MGNKSIQVRVNERLRNDSFSVLNQLNIEPNDAIRSFFTLCCLYQKITL